MGVASDGMENMAFNRSAELQSFRECCAGVQLVVVLEALNVVTDWGRRKLSVVTDGATGKRSAVPHFYPYKTRLGSRNLPLATAYTEYAVHVLPHTGTRLVPDYFCFIPEQIVFKEEQIVYRFERLDSGLIALFRNRFDIISNF